MSLRRSWLGLLAWLACSVAEAQQPGPQAPQPAPAPPALVPQTAPAPPPATPDAPTPAPVAPAEAAPPALPAAAPPVSPPAQALEPPAPSEQAIAAVAPAAEPEEPRKLAAGTESWFQPGILLQGWFLLDHADKTASTFRIRRAELSAKGDIIPAHVSYQLVIDPAMVLDPANQTIPVNNQDPAATDPAKPESVTVKQPTGTVSALKDLYITFQSEYLDASLGQFKIPVSWEGYNSSAKLLFAERALIAAAYGDKRDLGLRLAKTFKYFGYSAGLFNGAGLNNLDTNNGKDGGLRLEAYPVEGLTLAVVGYTTLWRRADAGSKDRWEIDARYENGPFLFQSEFIRARDTAGPTAKTTAQGFYAALAYMVVKDRLQPAVRIGYLDPDIHQNLDPTKAKGKDEVWHYDVGLNYYLRKNEVKLQLNYYRQQYQDKTANNEVILATQLNY